MGGSIPLSSQATCAAGREGIRAAGDKRLSPGLSGSPCNSPAAVSGIMLEAAAGGRPRSPGASKPVGKQGSKPVHPSNPNSRWGRSQRSPFAQGWDKMEIAVGIDVSKDRLDVHVWPSGEAFAVPRHHAGLLELQARLDGLGPARIGVEATGGYETVVAASLAGQGHPVVVVNPAQVRAFAVALGQRAKTDPIDAAVIARFVAATRPEIRHLT